MCLSGKTIQGVKMLHDCGVTGIDMTLDIIVWGL